MGRVSAGDQANAISWVKKTADCTWHHVHFYRSSTSNWAPSDKLTRCNLCSEGDGAGRSRKKCTQRFEHVRIHLLIVVDRKISFLMHLWFHTLITCLLKYVRFFIYMKNTSGRKRRRCIRTAVAEFIRLENYKIAENNCIAINSLEVSNAAVTFFIRAVIILTLFLAKFLSLTDFIIQFWFTVLRHQSNQFPFALSLPTIFGYCHLHCRLNSRHATTFSGAYFNYFLWFCAFLCEHISNITD